MGYAYLFALIVGMGILTIQAVLGSKDADAEGELGADKDFNFEGDADADFDADADVDLDADAGAHVGHAHGGDAHTGQELDWTGADFFTLFLSVRFWIFASLGFGLSGSLLHFFTAVSPVATAITAITMGVVSGLIAALAFRALRRIASRQAASTSSAVGRVARVIVDCPEEGTGQIRIELSGRTIDLMAKSGGVRIERGDSVLIEEVEGDVAQVSRVPEELK